MDLFNFIYKEYKMTNQTHRVCELIKRFNNNEKVCIDRLKDDLIWEGKSERSIRRDLEFVKIIFPGAFKLLGGEKGCYKALTKQVSWKAIGTTG